MNKKAILVIVAVAVIIAAVVTAVALNRKKDSGAENPVSEATEEINLEYFEVTVSGGSENTYYDIVLKVSTPEDIIVSSERRETNGSPTQSSRKKCEMQVVEEIERIIQENKITEWGSLKDKEDIALDAPTTVYRFVCDGREYEFNNSQQFPDNGYLALQMIYSLMEAQL